MKLFIFFAVILLSGCSFVQDKKVLHDTPKAVFENMTIVRYENDEKKYMMRADLLENYSAKKAYAANNLYIVQYKDNVREDEENAAELKASAKTALLLQGDKRFFLGGDVFVQTAENKITINAKNLFFDQAENMLYGAKGEVVQVRGENNLAVSGTDFAANTLSQEFVFGSNLKGEADANENSESKNAEPENGEREPLDEEVPIHERKAN